VGNVNPRQVAYRVLLQREEADEFVENLLEAELASANLSGPDRGLCTELVYGIVRRQSTLDWLISRKTQSRPQKPGLRILLRLGVYQLFWLGRVPDHAAVHETVQLAKRSGFTSQAGFLNAVLRAYTREKADIETVIERLKTSEPSVGYSHPQWLVERWTKRWGATEAGNLMDWNNVPPYTFARINTLKTTPENLLTQWQAEGVRFTEKKWDWVEEKTVFQLDSHPPIAQLPSFKQGLFYIQDPSTLLAINELSPRPEETILDSCAAPGGKATFIAQLMVNRGKILAQDIDPNRLRLVQENCVRLGVVCVHYSLATDQTPALHSEPTQNPQFDRILIDAPCSNTGVLRRRVDLRWRIRPEEITRLRQTQLKLLRQAAPRLKPGGTLVYSTCSVEPEENAEVVNEFLAEQKTFQLERQRELLPFKDGVDGAYVARLRRDR
jgi:16S rRNA (cytosine967-C5)-methyltransferase